MKNGRYTDDRVVRKVWPPHAYAGLNIARLLSTDVSRAESKVLEQNLTLVLRTSGL